MSRTDAALRRIGAAVVSTIQSGFALRKKPLASDALFVGLLAGAILVISGLHQADSPPVGLILAFALVPVTGPAGQIAVIAVAVALLIAFLFWSRQTKSASFFRGVLGGMGFVLSVDIVLVHWIFGLHHITNTRMDLVLEPLFVVLGLVFLWFAITRERDQAK